MPDITFIIDGYSGQTTFTANTPQGRAFLGGLELTVDNSEAETLSEQARACVTVDPFSYGSEREKQHPQEQGTVHG